MITDRAIWFFGLSGAGKTTIAKEVHRIYHENGLNAILLDGDILRWGINKNLGFSFEDRKENVRRIAEIGKLLLLGKVTPIIAAITPYEAYREMAQEIMGENKLIFVHVKCSLAVCEMRDPKGLYKLARKGILKKFTGISDVFEMTKLPVKSIDTNDLNIEQSISETLKYLAVQNE